VCYAGAVQCARCAARTAPGQRFCGRCGASLPAACARCGQANPPEFRFCGACGAPLGGSEPPGTEPPPQPGAAPASARQAVEGERRQVTVLFADVVDSTALAEALDPEDVHALMDRCLQLLTEQVRRYDGAVTQFLGDGLMALFGAPIAHENAPERAVRAGLGMQAAIARFAEELARTRGLAVRLRVGIHTGPVVVGRIGDDLRMDYTAIGDTTNLAARLQAAAAPGRVLVSARTARLVGGRFATRAVGPLVLKGKARPVAAHEIERALPRLPLVAGGDERDLTPLVGRAAELATLDTLFEHAVAGRGQVACIVGDAGIGKSRLLHELKGRLAARGVTWLEGRCVSFGRAMPLLPVVDVLKDGLGIEESDGEAAIVAKVQRTLATLGIAAAAAEPHLRALLAVDPGDPAFAAMTPSARRFALFDALKRVTLASAAERPLVVLIEDLHWLDQASEEWLCYVADAIVSARVLLLCSYRPGYRPPFGERSWVTRLALQPLSPEQTRVMTAAVLAVERVPAPLHELIASKADGNPFFVEEVTKSLLETGALRRTDDGLTLDRPLADIVIPDRIQDVIMARIDRLGDDPRRAIQIASVIGREFAVRLLKRASELGDGLDELVGELRALELIYEKSAVPELAYMFKHALTHDVAYESLLLQRRRALHGIVGRAIEELYADRLTEHWETLAHHFQRAEDWPRAFEYLTRAGEKALAAYANVEAVYFCTRALEAAEHTAVAPERVGGLWEAKARAHYRLSEYAAAVEAYRRALELLPGDADRRRLTAALGEALVWAHEFDEALRVGAAAREAADAAGDAATGGRARYVIGYVHALRGDLDGAGACLGDALRLAEGRSDVAQLVEMRMMLVLAASWQGDYGPALAAADSAIALLRESNALLALAEAYSHLVIAHGGAGRYAVALAMSDAGVALAESIGDRAWRARLWNTRGWMLNELGDLEAADEANRRSLEIAGTLGALSIAPELIGNAESNLADAALLRGDLPAAERHLDAVRAILADPRNEWMAWRYGMHYHATAAEAALARGAPGRAREHLDACLATATRTRSRRYLVRAGRLLAATQLAAGDVVGGEARLARVADEARTLGNPPQLWHALVAHGRALHALGRRDDAAARWREAVAVADGVAGRLPGGLAATFRRSAVHRTLAELGD
jgi:class 3 adenylate cyclase/tetratricopeptide (TPR) repeat protein